MILHLAHIRLTDARTFITLTSLKMGGNLPHAKENYTRSLTESQGSGRVFENQAHSVLEWGM
jgi:hypothetical protein